MCLSGMLNVIPFLIMGHKAFPQVYSVLGITPVYEWMGEGRVGWPFLPLSSHISYLLPCRSYTLRESYALENIRGQLHHVARAGMQLKLGLFFSAQSPSLHLTEKRRSGNFTCRYTIYEVSYNLHRLKIAERN